MPTYSRAELYELVWSESRLALSRKMAVSDVWIRKTCVRARIPVPPPRYWAPRAAGKVVGCPPLPQRGLGQNDHVTIGSVRYGNAMTSLPDSAPPLTEFAEQVEDLCQRAREAIGKGAIPKSLKNAAPAIDRLLCEDAERRTALATDRSAWKQPRFDAPAAQRRLRIVNALLKLLAHAGSHGAVDPETLETSVLVGDTRVAITLYAQGRLPASHWTGLTVFKARRALQTTFAQATSVAGIPACGGRRSATTAES